MTPVYRTNPAPICQLPLVGVDAEFMRFLAKRKRQQEKDAKP